MKLQHSNFWKNNRAVYLPLLLGILFTVSGRVAHSQDLNATYPFDANHKTRDITVPAGYKYLYVEAKGADGGKGTSASSSAGEGALVSGYVNIGNGTGQIPVGSTLRLIAGQVGGSETKYGGGGGGTGVAFKGPGTNDSWQLLAVAGGGGGSGNANGKAATSYAFGLAGNDSGGANQGNGGKDGNGGGHDGKQAYPGGGAFSDGSGGCPGRAGFKNNIPTGGDGGSTSCNFGAYIVRGGFGFGGGGSGIGDYPGGGGGGGYSGGGGGYTGSTNATNLSAKGTGGGGGGGASYADPDRMIMANLQSYNTTSTPKDGYAGYRFTNTAPTQFIRLAKDENKCFDLQNANTANGTNIQLYTCNNVASQQWSIKGANILLAKNLNKCIDLNNSNTANGANIQLFDCNSTNAQNWIYDGLSKNIRSGLNAAKCINLANAKTTDGNNIQLWDCNDIAAQRWVIDGVTLPTVTDTFNRIHSALATDKCIDVQGAKTTNGTNIQLYHCHNAASQYFHFDGNTIRYYQDQSKCLDLANSSTGNGANIQLFDCNGTNAQKWTYDGVSKSFRSWVNSGKCLDVDHSGTADNTNIQLYDCNGTDAQQFVIGN